MRTLASRALFFRRDTRASVQVETTFALLLAVPLIFVVFEVCAFTYTQALLGDAARAGVRYAVVHGSDSTACSGPGSGCSDSSGSNVTSMVQTYAGSLMSQLSTVTVTPSWPDSSSKRMSSSSICPKPCAMPPTIWPSRSSGFITVPTSSTTL